MGNIIKWLFTDAVSAGADTPSGKPEVFHFYLPWIVFCAAGLIIYFYYWAEGRKRFVKNHALHKVLLDKFMNQLALLAFVGPFFIFGRWAMDSTFFQWRVWRYLWLAWGVGIGAYWLVYFVRHYPYHRRNCLTYRTNAQYLPPPRAKRRAPARAGTR